MKGTTAQNGDRPGSSIDNNASTSTSTSSIQTQVVLGKKQKEDGVRVGGAEALPETPRHLLALGVSMSSPNLLNSSVSFCLGSDSSSSESVRGKKPRVKFFNWIISNIFSFKIH